MEEYVKLLIEDIREAARLAPDEFIFSTNDEEFMAQIVEAENTAPVSSEKLLGLMYIQLPPSDRLTIEQMKDLNIELEKTFTAFRMYIELPEAVPVTLRYELIRDLFKDKFQFRKGLNLHLDFCSGNCPPCPIADYCAVNIQNKAKSHK